MATTYPASIDNLRFVEAVMRVCLDNDMYSEILWLNKKGGGFRAAVMCSDIFYWGAADAEDLTPETLPLLEQAYKDCKAVKGKEFAPGKYVSNQYFGGLLYCARQRNMRPQGAYYKNLPPEIHHLFDACGPEREINIVNPQNQEGKYLYKKEEEE
jgi:hypothetical protein